MSNLQGMPSNAETIVFSGSSPEGGAYAKSFWHSVQLLPPMESRLVSSHISQRLKTAEAPDVNRAHPRTKEESFEITSYMAHVKELERAEECKKLMKFAAFREADMALLHKHRQTRVERENVSAGHSPTQLHQEFQNEDVIKVSGEDTEEIKEQVKDLDNFMQVQDDSDDG